MEIIINCPQISDDILKIETLLKNCDKRLPATRDGQTHMVDRQDIFYFEVVDKQCFIYTAKEVFETSLKLYEVENYMNEAGYIRSSKSQIINIMKIASLCPDFGGRMEVTMENGEKLIVSRRYTKIIKERLGL